MIDKNPIVAMRDALMAQPKGAAWVIATGALTNVGLLFATFPEVAAHIQGLSIMGGAIGGGFTDAPMSRLPGEHERIGNTTPWAEFNIYVRISTSRRISRSLLTSSSVNSVILRLPNLFSTILPWHRRQQ